MIEGYVFRCSVCGLVITTTHPRMTNGLSEVHIKAHTDNLIDGLEREVLKHEDQ